MGTFIKPLVIVGASALMLSSCQSLRKADHVATTKPSSSSSSYSSAAPRIGVNSFLWRAALETLDFMPMDNADPFGGVIVTDWYSNPRVPNERLKANVYILDTQLRADALKVGVFKQVNNGGGWADAAVDADTARQIENSILTRARELFIASN